MDKPTRNMHNALPENVLLLPCPDLVQLLNNWNPFVLHVLLFSIQFPPTLGLLLMTLLNMLQDVKNFFLFFLVLLGMLLKECKR